MIYELPVWSDAPDNLLQRKATNSDSLTNQVLKQSISCLRVVNLLKDNTDLRILLTVVELLSLDKVWWFI